MSVSVKYYRTIWLSASFPPHGGLFLIALSLAVLSTSACLQSKVAEASRRKAVEVINQGPAKKIVSDLATSDSNAERTSAPTPPLVNSTIPGDKKQAETRNLDVKKRLYIDGSKSMMGFAGQGGDFDKLLSEIGYILEDPIVFKFGSLVKSAAPKYADLIKPTTLGQEQKSPQFYSLYDNPDDVLFSEFSQGSKAALSVYISDGVYSAADSRAGSKVITPLTAWLENGGTLGIFVLKSRFKGSFYSEKSCSESNGRQCWLKDIDIPSRPFYVFVFSPTEQAFRNIQKELSAKFTDLKTLILSDGAIVSDGLTLPEVDSIYDSGPQSEGYYWQMFTASLFSLKKFVTLPFGLSYSINKDYPLESLTTNISARCYVWDQATGTFVESELPSAFHALPGLSPTEQAQPVATSSVRNGSGMRINPATFESSPLMGVWDRETFQVQPKSESTSQNRSKTRRTKEQLATAEPTPAGHAAATVPGAAPDDMKRADFQLQIPRDSRAEYTLYYMQIGVEVEAIDANVRELSTDDDANPLHANQTYRFAELIKALLTAHLKARLADRLAPPLFLTVSN